MVLCGMVWCCIVWYGVGMVWRCIVWYDMVW
jgi:hypothetical protein